MSGDSTPYLAPAQVCEVELLVKKSRFIARLYRAETREAALGCLVQARHDYPDARHHCWAYQIGPPKQPILVAMSDDGEPSGTAGKPILNVIQHKDVGDLMLVVIRYFGGIKLGAGGLVRAYSAAAQSVFEQARFEQVVNKKTFWLHCPFAAEQNIRHWADVHDADIAEVNYGVSVAIQVQVRAEDCQVLRDFCAGMEGCTLSEQQGDA